MTGAVEWLLLRVVLPVMVIGIGLDVAGNAGAFGYEEVPEWQPSEVTLCWSGPHDIGSVCPAETGAGQ